MGVTLVSTVPLPANPIKTQNVLANESKGLAQSQPKVREKEPDAIPIPDKNTKIKPKKRTTPTKRSRNPTPEEETTSSLRRRRSGQRPLRHLQRGRRQRWISDLPAAAEISARYAWYVRVVQQKVTENWLKYEVDPGITTAQRVYITFDMVRDGHPNVQIEQSSGVPSLDQSAVRAIQRIDTFGPLPPDYSAIRCRWNFGSITEKINLPF